MTYRRFLLPALLIITLVVGAGFAFTAHRHATPEGGRAVLEYRHEGLLYTFHVPTGTEALFDLKADPSCLENILPRKRREGSVARRLLEKKLRVQSLEELRDENDPLLKSLKGLGYI